MSVSRTIFLLEYHLPCVGTKDNMGRWMCHGKVLLKIIPAVDVHTKFSGASFSSEEKEKKT